VSRDNKHLSLIASLTLTLTLTLTLADAKTKGGVLLRRSQRKQALQAQQDMETTQIHVSRSSSNGRVDRDSNPILGGSERG
jgi:hypothetical protein